MDDSYFAIDEWQVREERFDPERNALTETIFALGNGYMGVRGTPEEGAGTAASLAGTFLPLLIDTDHIAGEQGDAAYPTFGTPMLACPSWTSIKLVLDGVPFDLQQGTLHDYRRVLNMREGTLTRELLWEDARGRKTAIRSVRFVCKHTPHLGAMRCTVTPLNYTGAIVVDMGLDATMATHCGTTEVVAVDGDGVLLSAEMAYPGQQVVMVARTSAEIDGVPLPLDGTLIFGERYAGRAHTVPVDAGKAYTFTKIVAVCTSCDLHPHLPQQRALDIAMRTQTFGFDDLLARHVAAWDTVWNTKDIILDGDPAAQQGIRFAIFHLEGNYAGDDPRLSVGRCGVSGPGNGRGNSWDAEVFLLPYYAFTEPEKAKMLLTQRFHTLEQARKRAQRCAFRGAMYPALDANGVVPAEWSMLGLHVNAAIPHAMRVYMQVSGDRHFLREYGAEIILETCRFWASRVSFQSRRQRYVLNTVTGPDEYAPVVNNNCYTNTMVKFTLRFGIQVIAYLRNAAPDSWQTLQERLALTDEEVARWEEIARLMYLPFDRLLGVHPQDDTFLDMDVLDVQAIPATERPLSDHWSLARLIRHQVVQQPDVLLLMFQQNERFAEKIKRANYDYYAPKTIHDTAVSPGIHAILATELGYDEQAMTFFRQSARLDLDDLQGDSAQGVHLAGMAGSWLSVVYGFAGLRLVRDRLHFTPHLPASWQKVAFTLQFRGRTLRVELLPEIIVFTLQGKPLTIFVNGKRTRLNRLSPFTIPLKEFINIG